MSDTKGIEQFRFTNDQMQSFIKEFESLPLLPNVVLADGEAKVNNEKAKRNLPGKVPGVYFWVMRWGDEFYRVYIGKSISIVGRLTKYTGNFQPKAPSDYKIRYFYDYMLENFPGATLNFYYKMHQLDGKKLHEKENELIDEFKPLINLRGIPKEFKQDILDANRSLYVSIFKKRLGA